MFIERCGLGDQEATTNIPIYIGMGRAAAVTEDSPFLRNMKALCRVPAPLSIRAGLKKSPWTLRDFWNSRKEVEDDS